MDYRIVIHNGENNNVAPVYRDVTRTHPRWIHRQLGTRSETELQRSLDTTSASDFYAPDGTHLGPDADGLEMYYLDEEGNRVERLRTPEQALTEHAGRTLALTQGLFRPMTDNPHLAERVPLPDVISEFVKDAETLARYVLATPNLPAPPLASALGILRDLGKEDSIDRKG